MGDRKQPNPPPVRHVVKPDPHPAPPPKRLGVVTAEHVSTSLDTVRALAARLHRECPCALLGTTRNEPEDYDEYPCDELAMPLASTPDCVHQGCHDSRHEIAAALRTEMSRGELAQNSDLIRAALRKVKP